MQPVADKSRLNTSSDRKFAPCAIFKKNAALRAGSLFYMSYIIH